MQRDIPEALDPAVKPRDGKGVVARISEYSVRIIGVMTDRSGLQS